MFAHDDHYNLMPIIEDWAAQFMHHIPEVAEAVRDELTYQAETTIAAYNFEDESASRDDLAADIVLCLKDIELDTYPELIYTNHIFEVFAENMAECEDALADFGGVQECESVSDAIYRGVHAYLAEEANILLSDAKEDLDNLESMLCE